MKVKHIIICILVLLHNPLLSQESTRSGLKFIDDCEPSYKIQSYFMHDTIIVQCDSIYVLNKFQFRDFSTILEGLTNIDYNPYDNLITTYKEQISNCEDAFKNLKINSEKTDKICSDLIDYSLNSIEKSQKNLDYAQKSLDQALKTLDHTNKLLKKERWNSIGQKILIGLGGVGAGILVGTLITN